ncbi:hypothetical protein CAPTEDRAFT_203755 [Capitella teleta]|uniref:Bacteriophage lambda Replication protein O N-terminal domain-containing protein n=1 Tax=Capitella teleta TaxID=283909 RepID=R7VK81_CAPTE|nr:hypothetical protein CAPTEDRAFT_203755 [Capitella teleta]|eukprot:ELU16560.1 hypothetical protein CAPTEDRAFT_203755 [Capitella teleta]
MDDGHTRIAHGLLEELMQVKKYKLSGREYAVLMVVLRKTYGYMKTEDWIALSQFELMTGIEKSNCRKVILSLVDRKILNRSVNGNDQKLSININVSEWLLESPSKQAAATKKQAKKQIWLNSTISESNSTISESNSTISESNSTTTIDKDNNNTLKDNVTTPVLTTPVEQFVSDDHSVELHEMVNQADQPVLENHIPDATEMVSQSDQPTDQPKTKTRKPSHKFTEADMAFALLMAQRIDAVNGTEEKRRNLNNWADELRKMREIDGRDPEQIAAVFNWCNQDDFWQTNIQSPATLRKKFAMLNGKCLKASANRNTSTTSTGWTGSDMATGTSNNVADLQQARADRQVQVFSELSTEDQGRIINGVFLELKNSFPGQFLKYEKQIAGWEDHERKRLYSDDDFRRLTARQIKNGLTTACKGEWLPSIGRLIQCCQPDLNELGLPGMEEAWQEACNHSHEVIQHRWSHEAVYLAGRRVGWHGIRSASGDIQVQRLKKIFTDAYQHLVDDTIRGADLRGEAIAALTDMRRQSEEEKATRYGQFLVQQEMDKQGIPQRMSGAEALKRMRAGL